MDGDWLKSQEGQLGVSPLQVTPYVMSILKHRGGEEGNRETPDSCSGGSQGRKGSL